MPRGGGAVLQPAQRIPAGMEFRLDHVACIGGDRGGDHVVSGLELAPVGEPAADDALLRPPFAGIDQLFAVLRQLPQQGGGVGIFALPAQKFDAGEEITGIVAEAGVDGGNQRRRPGGILHHRRPGRMQRLRLAEFGKAFRLGNTAAKHQEIHAYAMVVHGEESGIILDDPVFGRLVHGLPGPEPAQDRAGLGGIAAGDIGAHQGQRSLDGFRRRLAEGGENIGRRGIFLEQRLFGIGPQSRQPRPAGQLLLGGGDLMRGNAALARHDDRPGQQVPVEFDRRHGIADRKGAGRVLVGQCIQPRLQRRGDDEGLRGGVGGCGHGLQRRPGFRHRQEAVLQRACQQAAGAERGETGTRKQGSGDFHPVLRSLNAGGKRHRTEGQLRVKTQSVQSECVLT